MPKPAKFAPLSQQDEEDDGSEDTLKEFADEHALDGLYHDVFHNDETIDHDNLHHRGPLHASSSKIQALEIDNGTISAEFDPHAGEIGGDLKSSTVNIVKGMVGPAILYLPHGFAHAGWMVAIPVLFLSATLFLASSACLLQAWAVMDRQKSTTEAPPLSYPLLARHAFGSTGETVVKLGIAAMQSGVCLTYLIFVPQNLHESVLELFDWNVPDWVFLVVMLMIQIPLSWITKIRKLTVTNAFANALILYGLITCLLFAFDRATRPVGNMLEDAVLPNDNYNSSTTMPNGDNDSPLPYSIPAPMANLVEKLRNLTPFNRDGWVLFVGTSVLLFEGSITLLIPLQEAVQTQQDRRAFAGLYQKVILSIIILYTFFGLTCWMAFGNDVHTVMTTSLLEGVDDEGEASNGSSNSSEENSEFRILAAASVQLAYSLAVLLTFPLQNFPSLEIATSAIGNCCRCCHRHVISSLIIILLGIIAVLTMDSLDKVVSLMGALLGCPLAFCIPPLIHNRLVVHGDGDVNNFENNTAKPLSYKRWQSFKNNFIVVLGFLAMILASIATLAKW